MITVAFLPRLDFLFVVADTDEAGFRFRLRMARRVLARVMLAHRAVEGFPPSSVCDRLAVHRAEHLRGRLGTLTVGSSARFVALRDEICGLINLALRTRAGDCLCHSLLSFLSLCFCLVAQRGRYFAEVNRGDIGL